MNREYFVYILTNWNNHVMYIGVTNNLQRRLKEDYMNTKEDYMNTETA